MPFRESGASLHKSDSARADDSRVELTRIIRPALVIEEAAAARIVAELSDRDVGRGGCWNATSTIWQRYTGAWNGVSSTRGSAQLAGTIAVAYGMPIRDHITIYRVTITEGGRDLDWTVEALCDEALGYGGLTLDACPRADLMSPPTRDPFKARRGL